MSIGSNIMRKCDALGITRAELAKDVDVTPTFICDVVKGYKIPSVPLLVKISRRLGVSLDWLVYADGGDVAGEDTEGRS